MLFDNTVSCNLEAIIIKYYTSIIAHCSSWSSSPAVAFSPAQNHEIELVISLINQVPRVPAREDNLLNTQGDGYYVFQ